MRWFAIDLNLYFFVVLPVLYMDPVVSGLRHIWRKFSNNHNIHKIDFENQNYITRKLILLRFIVNCETIEIKTDH